MRGHQESTAELQCAGRENGTSAPSKRLSESQISFGLNEKSVKTRPENNAREFGW